MSCMFTGTEWLSWSRVASTCTRISTWGAGTWPRDSWVRGETPFIIVVTGVGFFWQKSLQGPHFPFAVEKAENNNIISCKFLCVGNARFLAGMIWILILPDIRHTKYPYCLKKAIFSLFHSSSMLCYWYLRQNFGHKNTGTLLGLFENDGIWNLWNSKKVMNTLNSNRIRITKRKPSIARLPYPLGRVVRKALRLLPVQCKAPDPSLCM